MDPTGVFDAIQASRDAMVGTLTDLCRIPAIGPAAGGEGEAKKAEVKHSKELFDRAHARTVGLIFNKISESSSGYYYYYYYRRSGYGPEETTGERALPRARALSGSRRRDDEEKV